MDTEKPSKRNIEQLLKELHPGGYAVCDTDEVRRLGDEYDAIEAQLREDKRLVELAKKLEKARQRAREAHAVRLKKYLKVRQRYWTEGPTPAVLKAIKELVLGTEGI